MKYLMLPFFLSFSLVSFSQENGRNLHAAGQQERLRLNQPNTDTYVAESTSPFFSDKWMRSVLVFENGKTQTGLIVKLDLFENKIYFLDDSGNENISTSTFKEIVLADSIKTYRLIHSSAIKASGVENGWYQILCNGKVELYKKTIKSLPRSMSQPAEGEMKPLETSRQFFILVKEKLVKVKKGKDIPEAIEDRKAELQEYARSKNLNGKGEEDMVEIVTYYNSLK